MDKNNSKLTIASDAIINLKNQLPDGWDVNISVSSNGAQVQLSSGSFLATSMESEGLDNQLIEACTLAKDIESCKEV